VFTAVSIPDQAGVEVVLFDGTHKLGECHGLHGVPLPRRIVRPRPGMSGEINETRFAGSRQPVWNGMLVGANAAALWATFDDLLGALWGMVEEARLLRWTRADGVMLQSLVKLGDAFDPVMRAADAGHVLQFQLVFDREDPRNYAQSAATATGAALSDVGAGFGVPFGFGFGFTPGGSGAVAVANGGTIETPGTFTIYGAVTNPVVQQQSTGRLIAMSASAAAGSTLTVDGLERTVVLDGVTDRGNTIDFAATDWRAGLIPPGGDTYKLLATTWDASARLDVTARDAYA
jgi:hypothetical protein